MKLHEFIVKKGDRDPEPRSGPRTNSIDEKEAISFINEYCKNYVHNKNFIYRGIGTTSDFLKGDSTQSVRRSANTENYYTFLLDNILPSWRKYPDRSKSFICSSSKYRASMYGNVYVVFPKDGTPLGVAPEEDIWDSFDNLDMFNLNMFNRFIQNLFNYVLGKKQQTRFDHSLEKFKNTLKSVDQELQNMNKEQHEDLFDFMTTGMKSNTQLMNKLFPLKQGETLVSKLNTLMNPDHNGFQLIKAEQNKPSGKECWFKGEAVFVHINSLDKILKKD